jgi:hypothetical protein
MRGKIKRLFIWHCSLQATWKHVKNSSADPAKDARLTLGTIDHLNQERSCCQTSSCAGFHQSLRGSLSSTNLFAAFLGCYVCRCQLDHAALSTLSRGRGGLFVDGGFTGTPNSGHTDTHKTQAGKSTYADAACLAMRIDTKWC